MEVKYEKQLSLLFYAFEVILWVVHFHWSEICFFSESCGRIAPPLPLHFYIRVLEPSRIPLYFLFLFLGETAVYKPVKSKGLLYRVLSTESHIFFWQ